MGGFRVGGVEAVEHDMCQPEHSGSQGCRLDPAAGASGTSHATYCGENTLLNAMNAATAADAATRRSRRPRAYHQTVSTTAATSASDVAMPTASASPPTMFFEPRRLIAQRRVVDADAVEHEERRTAQALDFEAAPELEPVAVAQPAGPHHGEREMEEDEDTDEPPEATPNRVAATALPGLNERQREQHEREDLRSDGECKQGIRDSLPVAHEREDGGDGEQRREEVVGVEEDRAHEKR